MFVLWYFFNEDNKAAYMFCIYMYIFCLFRCFTSGKDTWWVYAPRHIEKPIAGYDSKEMSVMLPV